MWGARAEPPETVGECGRRGDMGGGAAGGGDKMEAFVADTGGAGGESTMGGCR